MPHLGFVRASTSILRRALPASGVLILIATLGIASSEPLAPPGELPPNTILLSQMMRELSSNPNFTEALLAQIDKGGKKGPALLTPTLVDDLRKRILGRDWQGLDRFPGWTMSEINPTVRVAGHFIGKNEKAENLSAAHPGASPTAAQLHDHLDVGPYSLDHAQSISLRDPSPLPGFSTDGLVTTLGAGVTRGDGPNELAPEHRESQRLADVLNRLSANSLDGTAKFTVQPLSAVGHLTDTPEALIRDLQSSGHEVIVQDARYFANFGHFHYKGQDVMAPFWVNTQVLVPGTHRPLLVPAAHAEYEWHIHGPILNADVSHYFGIDGKSEWRTMDTLDQPWVMKRNAHTYRDADAAEVTRLLGLMTVAYLRLHAAHPTLPFGGYYALGVCQDLVAAVELRMTGKATLFPNTADGRLFTDPRDAEVNALIKAIPKDRDGLMPQPERIFGSLPTDDLAGVTIPGLGPDLVAVHQAWTAGTLERTGAWKRKVLYLALAGLAGFLLFAAVQRSRRTRRVNMH